MTPETDKQPLLVLSCLSESVGDWQTAVEYKQSGLAISATAFASATNVLLTQPNLNSSHLFRADILYDSAKYLKTPAEYEIDRGITAASERNDEDVAERTPECFTGFTLTRTVIRRLIPRNPQLDKSLLQTCHIYDAGTSRHLVVYQPHVSSAEATPWYHPPIRALAYLYETATSDRGSPLNATISVHILLFEARASATTIPNRLHRTLLSLLHTLIRLTKSMSQRPPGASPNVAIAPKDNVIPQHIVQNTYSRLKRTYSTDLISRWVEKTDPSKHVFEDLSIAAFLIELWRQMYGLVPSCERSATATYNYFPGFVDIACGNGVLVYVLRKEGYDGWGFDARRRRTWEIFPEAVQQHLLERVLVPEPYLRATSRVARQGDIFTGHLEQIQDALGGIEYHDGIFEAGTFIVSNHADELTPWTPILAALSSTNDPLPWLAIPCCSHALSGARYRYPLAKPVSQPQTPNAMSNLADQIGPAPTDIMITGDQLPNNHSNGPNRSSLSTDTTHKHTGEHEQPATGDLKALRAAKAKAASGADQSSMYACLTAKVVALAEELGIETEKTLMRIPSTRNIGILGGRRIAIQKLRSQIGGRDEGVEQRQVGELQERLGALEVASEASASPSTPEDATVLHNREHANRREVWSEDDILSKIEEVLERECTASGGVEAAAQIWIERAKSLQIGQGRGKLNAGKAHG
jgi:tRNASer (uridine44-2'-O)-methyltransferase